MAFAPVFGRLFAPTFDRNAAVRNGLLNGLVAYWPLNEASGNALDAHTNGLTLTDTNTVTNAAGKVYGTARKFVSGEENGEYLIRPSADAVLSTGDVDFTIAAWIYLDSMTFDRVFVSKDSNSAGGREYLLRYQQLSNRMRFVCFDGSNVVGAINATSLGAPSLGAWYLIVAAHDSVANTVSLQANGGAIDSAMTAGAPAATATQFTIGQYKNPIAGNGMDGRIGPVAFWKSAAGAGGVLTAAQRTALYNAGAGLAYSAFTT